MAVSSAGYVIVTITMKNLPSNDRIAAFPRAAGLRARLREAAHAVAARPISEVNPLSDQELRMLTNSVPVRIAVVDREQRYRFSNLAHQQSWGGLGGEIVGRTMEEVLGPENYLSARPYVERALSGEEVSFEMTVSYRSTEPRFVRVHYLPQHDIDNTINGCLILALDITERRLSQEALRQSEARFGKLVEHTPVIPWELDLKSQLFTFVGHRAEELLGYSIKEWMKTKFHSHHLHADDLRRVTEEFARAATIGEEFETEYRLIHKDGSVIWFRDLVSVISRNGEIVALQGLLIDITASKQADFERRRLEDRLREFQKMQALGTLAGGIAHDFNNILGGIIGYTELALSTLGNPEQGTSYLERIKESSYRARDLVSQILSFSRGKEVSRQQVKLSLIINEVLALLRATVPSNITLELAEGSEDLFVSVNVTQIHQVILNICTNAAHAMKGKGGRLSISLEKLSQEVVISRQIPELSLCDYASIRVIDTGHGMSAEVMERIFEPYYTTKAVGDGTGLGLAVAHGIISNHGGTITVTSDLGQGTCFEVFIPLADGHEVGSEEIHSSSSLDIQLGLQARIVVVDDEPSLVEIGRDMLQHLGYDVIGFTSSTEAFEYITRNIEEIDLVITDQTMPNMSGDALIKKIKVEREDLPIILCTGYSAVVDAHGADRLGVAAFLAKPYSIVQLCSTVKTVLAG